MLPFPLLLLCLSSVYAVKRTILIDDQYGDSMTGAMPVYTPDGGWAQGAQCSGCGFQPDPTKTYRGTWHDTTHHTNDPSRAIQFSFPGTELAVFCIIPNPSNPSLTSQYDLQFILDGVYVGNYTHVSDNSTNYLYQYNVYNTSNLPDITHTFIMVSNSTTINSTILFDYAQYVFDDGTFPSSSSPSPSSTSWSIVPTASPSSGQQNTSTPSNLPAIVGGVLGGLAFLTLLGTAIYLYRRYQRAVYLKSHSFPPQWNTANASVDPFIMDHSRSFVTLPQVIHPPQPPQPTQSRTGHSRHTSDPSITLPSSSNSTAGPSNLSVSEIVTLRQQLAQLRSLVDQNPPNYRSP